MRCLGCKKIISVDEQVCPHCGYDNELYDEPVLKKENMFTITEKKETDISDILDIKEKKTRKRKDTSKVKDIEKNINNDISNQEKEDEVQTYLDFIDDNIEEVLEKIDDIDLSKKDDEDDTQEFDNLDKTVLISLEDTKEDDSYKNEDVITLEENSDEESEDSFVEENEPRRYVETEEEIAMEKATQEEIIFSGRYEDLEDSENDLDDTKEFNVDVSLDKTIAITTLDDTKELDNLSLIDDINNQIDRINKDSVERTGAVEVITEPVKQKEVPSENLKSRKKIFLITGLVILLLFATLVGTIVGIMKEQRSESKINYVDKLGDALHTYYETDDIDDVIYILEEVKKDDEKVTQIHTKTKIICDSWILLYLNEEVENKDKFEKATSKYKGLIDGLYNYALVKNKDKEIRALTYNDYILLIEQIDDIYSDSAVFYDGLELYNDKDYNKAYYMFGRVDKDNSYYDKSVSYNNKIVSNIIELIEKDIDKLEDGIDSLSDRDKLKRYTDIEQIIIDYPNVYSSVKLKDSLDYKELLSKYTSKVSEYTDIVQNSSIENLG